MKAYKRLSILCIAVLLCALLPVLAGATSPGDPPEVADPNPVYVRADGDDDGAGSETAPYATLAKAVTEAEDGATIYVMSDLTMTESARFWNKNLTITSFGEKAVTVSRGESFTPVSDPARQGYNGAMLEVGGSQAEEQSSLVLSNIIFDDKGLRGGDTSTDESPDQVYFIQAASDGDGNTDFGNLTETNENPISNLDIVQDAIIATYNGTGTITLSEGAVLKNYGGMSAVRLSGGELIMEAGSSIVDDTAIERTKGTTIPGADKGLYGPAGAVWIQGGTLTMDGGTIGGAEGFTMSGRAVYVDSGTANVGGTIQNLKGTDAAWQGQNGVAIHLRAGGEATLTETGKITNVTGTNAGNNTAIWTQFCNFTTEKGSVISEVDGFQLLYFDDLDNNNYSHEVYLDGTISDCASGPACLMRSWYGQITFGENSVIENCSSSSAGGLIYSNNGSHYTFAGTIRNNRASKGMIYLANQSGGGVIATIEKTAHIVDNTGLGIRVNNSSNLTMNGGEIARNSSYGVQVSAKDSWKGVKFIMKDGVIADNGGVGVDATIGGDAVVQLNGGSIYGNGGGTEVQVWNDYTDSPNAYAENANDHLYIADGVLQGKRTVKVEHGYSSFLGAISLNRTLGTVTLDEGHGEVAWAFANPAAVEKMTDLVTAHTNRTEWEAAMEDAYWIKPNASSYHFTVTRPEDATKTDLYLAYIPMNADGSVPDDAQLTLKKVGSGDQIDVTMDGLDASKSYAFMFFNSSEYTLAPDDITVYTGGGQGSETYDDGFPALTIGNSVDPITSFTIDGANVDGTDLMAELLNRLEVTYTDASGNKVTSDAEAGEYKAKLSWKDGLTDDQIRINGNNVKLGEGTLIVRYIENVEEAQQGANTYPLMTEEEITAPVENAVAVAKKGGWAGTTAPEFYTNDDEDREVDAGGIQLLVDGLLRYEGENRQRPMEEKAEAYLGAPAAGKEYHYEFHYLDLVDAFNGNAWVSAEYGTTVYLPYPEGITPEKAEEMGVKVIHYKDLHREYGITGQDDIEQAIAACEMETMDVEFTAYGIKFDVEREGFSPFAVVWQETAVTPPVTPSEPADPDDTGVSDLLDTENHNQYLFGYPEGTFGPDQNMTRAEVAQMFYNLLVDKNVAITASFEDVPADAWYAKSVNTLASMGIISGVGENRFEPERSITRAEFTSMAMKFTKGALDGTNVFSDVHSGDWFYEAVVGSIQYGWIEGYEDGTFRPENRITRVEVTSIVNKMLGRFADREFVAGHADELNSFSDVTSTHWGYYHIVEATNSHTYTKPSTNVETWTELK